jgi:hypothetical protein
VEEKKATGEELGIEVVGTSGSSKASGQAANKETA